MNQHQRRWQAAALKGLLANAGTYKRGPWVPAGEAVAVTQIVASCTSQAATGALRALRTAGLADSCETMEGSFWKATPAAERFVDLRLEESLKGDS